MCPNCGITKLTEMDTCACPECSCETFEIIQPAAGQRMTGSEPTARCTDCGHTGTIDADGVWW